MNHKYLFLFVFFASTGLSACAPLPPAPVDIAAKRFEAIPDKAVIYIVRTSRDSRHLGQLSIGDKGSIATLAGTYYRWEVDPGPHVVSAFGSAAQITVHAVAGKVHFVRQTVLGGHRLMSGQWLAPLDEAEGRRLVMNAEHI